MNGDNPAARLHAILVKAKGKPISQNCRAAWSDILNVSSKNESKFLMHMGKVSSLPYEIFEFVKAEYPNQVSTTTHWSTQINSAFLKQNYNSEFSTFITKIDNHSLDNLSLLSDLIASKTSTTVLDEDSLNKMRVKVQELIDEMLGSDLTKEFKEYLNKALNQILEHINSYIITGINPIIDSLDMVLGHAVTDIAYRNELKESGFGEKLLGAFHFLASFTTLAAGIAQHEDLGKFYLSFVN
ncbi:MAG: hypothetical protein ACI87I_000416 [Pseudoalteromonas tetraodonis]|jgi:hypothetical protein|uniref:hypothetical protein n=1 Tax=Pseudoalteromonas tetraodonis TaxID=43659 RepID=UPI00398A4876